MDDYQKQKTVSPSLSSKYLFEKPEGIFRIVVMGASIINGTGLPLEKSPSHLLETKLNEGLEKKRFEVIPILAGFRTRDLMYSFFLKALEYQPNMILWSRNDVSISPPNTENCFPQPVSIFSWQDKLPALFATPHLIEFLKPRISNLIYSWMFPGQDRELTCYKEAYAWDQWEFEKVYMDVLFMACRLKNIHLLLALTPSYFLPPPGKSYPLDFARQTVIAYSKKRGIDYIDLYLDGFKGKNPDEYRLPMDIHWNEYGSEIAATAIFNRIKELRNYKNIFKLSEGLPLTYLLNYPNLTRKADIAIDRSQENNTLQEVYEDNSKVLVEHKQDGLYLQIDSEKFPTYHEKTFLNRTGRFLQKDRVFTSPLHGLYMRESIENKDDKQYIWSIVQVGSTVGQVTKRVFRLASNNTETQAKSSLHMIEIEQGVYFMDPMSLYDIYANEGVSTFHRNMEMSALPKYFSNGPFHPFLDWRIVSKRITKVVNRYYRQ